MPASFRPKCARTKRVATGALAVVAGAGSAEEAGWRERIALSFAPVVRNASPYQPAPDVSRLEGRRTLAGATVANLSFGLNRDPGLDLFAAGGIVLKVDRATPAARLRLRRGDLIRAVAAEPIDELAELETILRERRLPWQLEVERGGQRLAVVIGG